MTILLVCAALPSKDAGRSGYSGAARRAIRQARCFAAAGRRAMLLTDTPLPRQVDGVAVCSIKGSAGRIDGARGLSSAVLGFIHAVLILRRHRPSTVLVYSCGRLSLLVLCACHVLGIPAYVSTTLLGGDDPLSVRGSSFGWMKLYLLRRCHGIINNSPALASSSAQAGIKPERNWLVPNPVDLNQFSLPALPIRAKLRERLGCGSAQGVFVCVGAVNERKRTMQIVAAFQSASRIRPDLALRLFVVGPLANTPPTSDYVQEVMNFVESNGLNDSVVFVGETECSRDWLQAGDVFLSASNAEGFPSAMVEAMATGLPVVAWPIKGVTDYILDGLPGCSHVNSVAEQADAMIRLVLRSPEEVMSQAEVIRKSVCERFSAAQVTERYLQILEGRSGHP